MVTSSTTTVFVAGAASAAAGMYVWRRQGARVQATVYGPAVRSLRQWALRTLAEGARGADPADGGKARVAAPEGIKAASAATDRDDSNSVLQGGEGLCDLNQKPIPADPIGAEEQAPQRLLQARAGLALAFKEAFEDKSGGFRLWWNQADPPSKMKLLRGARVLVERRLTACGMGGVLCLLCPEVAEKSLPAMFHSLPNLIQGRINDVYAVKANDRAFVVANCAHGADSKKVDMTVYNRQLLMAIFFTDVLGLYKHLSHGVIAGC